MAAGKHLPGFCITAAALALLLFFFGERHILALLAVFLLLGAGVALLLAVDAKKLRLELRAAPGGRAGQPLPVTLAVVGSRRFRAAGQVTVRVEVESVMFGETRQETLSFPLEDGAQQVTETLNIPLCGETRLRCAGVEIGDLMGLFRIRCAPFPESRTLLYPPETQLELLLSRETVGAAQAEGLMQNRRGSDPSEIFDIRDYVPGDDIRTVHWKLSAKTGSLIVRQASDPSHYDAALLPDLGLPQKGAGPTAEELVRAVSVTVALGEGLLRQGTAFCMAIPTPQGLELHEVRSTRAFARLIPRWMGARIPAEGGLGLHLFQTEHLESHFTRLLVVSAGKYAQDPGGLDRRIGVTVVSCDGTLRAPVYTALGPVWESVALPAQPGAGESFRIIC